MESIALYYQKYRAKAADPVLKQTLAYLDNLNADTTQPLYVESGAFGYYFSSKDHVLNYTDSTEFCKLWGGQLLAISSETEYKTIKNVFPGRSSWYGHTYGYDLFDESSKETGCKIFDVNLKRLRIAACDSRREFMCRKIVPLDFQAVDDTTLTLELSVLQPSPTYWWIVLLVAIVLIILILIVCCWQKNQTNSENSNVIAVKKLADKTPNMS